MLCAFRNKTNSAHCFNNKNNEIKIGKLRLEHLHETHLNWRKCEFLKNLKSPSSYPNMDNNNYFDLLPDELILFIFQKLPKFQLRKMALVCKRFNQLIQDESLWSRLDLSNQVIKRGVLGILMNRQVLYLSLSRSKILFSPILPHIKAVLPDFCWRLRFLDLTDTNITISCLVTVFSKCKKLRKVSLENVRITDDVLSALSQNSNLEVINFTMTKGITEAGLKSLLTKCRKLKELNFFWASLTPASIDLLCTNLPPTLHSLSIPSSKIQDKNVIRLVTTCPNLQQLDLSGSPLLTDAAISKLSNLEKIKFLDLTYCHNIAYNSILALKNRKSLRLVDTNGYYINYYGFRVNKGITLSPIARPTKRYQKSTIWNVKLFS